VSIIIINVLLKPNESFIKMNGFRLQPHQQRALGFLDHTDRLLLYHGLGSGKTCTSVSLALSQQGYKRIVVIAPASLVSNFRQEILGECGGQPNLNMFWIVSKDKLYRDYKDRLVDLCEQLKNTVIVVDEVHRLLSYKDGKEFVFFHNVLNCVRNKCKCVFLSATPLTDPYKLVPLARFLLSDKAFRRSCLHDVDTASRFFDRYYENNVLRREQELVDLFRNRVSHFRCPRGGFPTVVQHDVRCYIEPNTKQHRVYKTTMGFGGDEGSVTQEFLLSARMASNLATRRRVRTRERLMDVSVKFHTCLEQIANKKGPFFVYSNFVAESGVEDFTNLLKRLYNYSDTLDIPFRRYAMLRSGDSSEHRQAILDRFNSPTNADGRLINIIVGSPSSNEGITLKKLRSIHILDPHWMPTVTDQIIARGVRFNSHAGVDYDEVHVYHYLAIPRDITLLSVDIHLRNIQNEKRTVLSVFESVLQKASIESSHTYNNPRRVINNTDNNYVITTVVRDEEDLQHRPAPKKRLRRITRFAPYNPRTLNRSHKKPKKNTNTWIDLTNKNDVINLTVN
jgi:hypothetical protein